MDRSPRKLFQQKIHFETKHKAKYIKEFTIYCSLNSFHMFLLECCDLLFHCSSGFIYKFWSLTKYTLFTEVMAKKLNHYWVLECRHLSDGQQQMVCVLSNEFENANGTNFRVQHDTTVGNHHGIPYIHLSNWFLSCLHRYRGENLQAWSKRVCSLWAAPRRISTKYLFIVFN